MQAELARSRGPTTMSATVTDGRPDDLVADVGGTPPPAPEGRGLHRYVVAVGVAMAAVTVPYLWVLWDLWTGRVDALRQLSPDNFYDLQGRALLAGHLWVPNGSLGIEAFVHGGRQYTYFGLFPSLLRLPVLAVTHAYDGRLTAPSMLLAWVVTGVVAPLLLWRVRVLVRGDAVVGWAEAAACGVSVAALTGGSVLVYLASEPKVSRRGPGLERRPGPGRGAGPARCARAAGLGAGVGVRRPDPRRRPRPGAHRLRVLPGRSAGGRLVRAAVPAGDEGPVDRAAGPGRCRAAGRGRPR